MFYHRRLQSLTVALLLAILPAVGLASFARDSHLPCTIRMQTEAHAARAMMSEHCKTMAHDAAQPCKNVHLCPQCGDMSTPLACAAEVARGERYAVLAPFHPDDFLLSSLVAGLWRPPRSV